MMKKKQQRATPFDQDMTVTPQGTQPEPVDPTDEQLDEVFREFPQNDACLELWRTTEKGGRPVFVDDLMPSEFSFGAVCKEWGGGKYLIKGKYKDGSTIKRSFEIGGEPFPIKRKVPQGNPEPSAPIPAQPGQPSNQTIEMARRDDGSYDMAALITGMMGMMKTMVTELRTSEVEMLEKMKMYRDLFGVQEKPQTPIAEAISMIKTGIELGSTAQGGDGGFPWMMALDKLQGPLTELVSTIKAAVTRQPVLAPAQNSLTPPAQPTGQPAQPAQSAQPAQPTQGDTPNMEMILKSAVAHVLPNLVTGAAKEAEPGFYADFLLDQIPRRFYATAKIWLEKPDCVDQLQQMNPGVAEYRDWFETLRSELLKSLNQELGYATGTIQPEPTSDATADRSADL